MSDPIERCPKCGAVIALVGRIHNCRPREADEVVTSVPVTGPKPKPKFGDAVNVPLSEMPARGIGPKRAKSSRGGVESGHASDTEPNNPDRSLRAVETVAAGAAPGPREAKPRARKGTAVYPHRDADKHRDYQKKLMKARRAKTKTLAEA